MAQWYDQTSSGVVRVEAYQTPMNWKRPDIVTPQKSGVGTGFFVPLREGGEWVAILTCAHVLDGCLRDQISIVFPKVGQERWQTAFVHCLVPEYDLGIIVMKLPEDKEVRSAIRPLPLMKHQTRNLVGQKVSAYGYPLGKPKLKYTQGQYSGFADNGFIQTNADISPGNSGGPLILESTGEVIGVNAMTMGGMFVSGVHFAVPIQLYHRMAKEMLSNLEPRVRSPPSLGFCYHVATEALLRKNNVMLSSGTLSAGARPGGVYVYHLLQDSPLRQAGMKEGAIITRINIEGEWLIVDRFGEVQVLWNGEQRVALKNVLPRVPTEADVLVEFTQSGQQTEIRVKQRPLAPGSLHTMSPPFEAKPDYCLFGGLCVMPLRANHAAAFALMFRSMGTKQREANVLVVSAVMPGYTQGIPFKEGDIIEVVNGKGTKGTAFDASFQGERVDTVAKYRDAIKSAAGEYITMRNTKGYEYTLSKSEALQRERALAQVYTCDEDIMRWLSSS